MRLYRVETSSGISLLAGLRGKLYELTDRGRRVEVSEWLRQPEPVEWLVAKVGSTLGPVGDEWKVLAPADMQEVWASGVTYHRSKVARMEESKEGGDFYDKVYDAERPEIFFKSNASRVIADGKPIRIRRDSDWNVPEPELVLVFSSGGEVVGYTVGNDVSSRSIEGENPLYLPQAKVYDGSCSMGPGILVKAPGVNGTRRIEMTVERRGQRVFSGEVSTENIKRSEEELGEFLFREMSFPHGVFLFTGTGIVPPDDFTLMSADTVRITIEGIGTLENPVA